MNVKLSPIVLLLPLAALLPSLQGCVPLVAGAAVGTGALIAEDRRSSGTYLDDEGIEIKALGQINANTPKGTHVNVTSFNRLVLLTGEAPTEQIRLEIGGIAAKVSGVRTVVNEVTVAPESSLGSRSNDTYITSRVKTRFIEGRKFQANHVKVVTENGIVYLMGLVRKSEAESAADIASRTSGVKKVVQVFEYVPES